MNPKRHTVAIIQARMGSTRLPGKMLKDLCGYPVLSWVLQRVMHARSLDLSILATSDQPRDEQLGALAAAAGVRVYRGSEHDVLDRFLEAARTVQAEVIVRVCADNPLIAPEEIDALVDFYFALLHKGAQLERLYAFNHIPAMDNGYPDGLGAEICSTAALEQIARLSLKPVHREHVTSFIWDHPDAYDIVPLKARPEIAYPRIKLDIDTQDDLDKLNELCRQLSVDCTSADIVRKYLELF